MDAQQFFDHLWQDYIQMAPHSANIKKVFESKGETILNDHVAFRTFGLDPINIPALEKPLLDLGYSMLAPYRFEAKKLNAFGYTHPDEKLPRVFISALDCDAISDQARDIIQGLVSQIDAAQVSTPGILWAGRLWEPIRYEDYQTLLQESEYAAWVAALGIRPNHFTIAINYLKTCHSVEEVLQVVEAQGIAVNESGGRTKGSPEVLLEQGSSLADKMPVEFSGGETHEIPTCYYEFALRYPDKDGKLYQGFVAASADKIFESTHVKPSTKP